MLRSLRAAALVFLLGACAQLQAAPRSELISTTAAARHGLTRPWFTQVEMDPNWARVQNAVLDEGTLFVQTDRAVLTAIEAETGRTLWARQIGRPDQPSMPPGMGRNVVAVVNGARLYVVNRRDGNLRYDVRIAGAPGGGPAVTDTMVYVPMISGLLMAYYLRPMADAERELAESAPEPPAEEDVDSEAGKPYAQKNVDVKPGLLPPLYCASPGRAMVQPLVTRHTSDEQYVVWTTDRGVVSIGRLRPHEGSFVLLYQLRSQSQIVTRPTYLPPDPKIVGDSGVIYAATIDGYVYALRENSGKTLWRFSTGDPIMQSAEVIDDRVYVAVQTAGMYCLDAHTGASLWWSPDIAQFVAAGKQRVYVVDKLNRLLALNPATGARLDAVLMSDPSLIKVANTETDRLYLVSSTGLVQSLREFEQAEPLVHNANRKPSLAAGEARTAAEKRRKKPAVAKETAKKPAAAPAEEASSQPAQPPPSETPAVAEDPFAAPADGAKGAAGRKGSAAKGGEAKPAAKDAAPDDPFATPAPGK